MLEMMQPPPVLGGGEMLLGEALFKPLVEAQHALHWMVPAVCALLVLGIGKWLVARKAEVPIVRDLADGEVPARKIPQGGEA